MGFKGFQGFLGVVATRPRCLEGKLTKILFTATRPHGHVAKTLKLPNRHSPNTWLGGVRKTYKTKKKKKLETLVDSYHH